METKRLFVGGLFRDVSEEELRLKFGHFGEVTDVRIVHKADSEGNIVKTFSYIDMKCPKGNYDRCVNIFDKSKWKGGQVSVQLAKESFLEKLAKERSESAKTSACEAKQSNENDAPPPSGTGYQLLASKARSTKNTPGTKVPGATKWVVGKYGMVLPVVQLRDPNGRKVVRHDPSMHCHRIKRFREDEGDVGAVTLRGLDLGVDQTCDEKQHDGKKDRRKDPLKPEAKISKGGKSPSKKEKTPNKNCQLEADRVEKRLDDVRANGKKEPSQLHVSESIDVKKRTMRGTKNEKSMSEKQCGESIGSLKSPQLSMSIVQQIELRNRTASQNNTEPVTVRKRSPSAVPEGDALYSVQSLVTEAKSAGDGELLPKKKRRKRQGVNGATEVKQQVKEKLAKEGNASLEKCDMGRDDKHGEESSDFFYLDRSTTEGRKTENGFGTNSYSRRNTESTPLESAVVTAWPGQDQGSRSLTEGSLEDFSQHGDDLGKRAFLSEQKRLSSVNRLRSARLKQQNIIKSSLQNPDIRRKGKQHITFDEDESEEEKEEKEEESALGKDGVKEQAEENQAPASQQKISGSASLSWLGLDEEEEGETTDALTENMDLFPLKPHFEGEKGHKLFKLQQAIGSDARFTLSEKFLESDSDEDLRPETEREKPVEEIPAFSGKVGESDVDLALREERERSLRILQGILGTTVTSGSASKTSHKTWDLVRFDPSVESHREFEVKAPAGALEPPSTDKETSDNAQGGEDNEEKNTQISEERYYDVSASLRDLFGTTESSGFSFLAGNDEEVTTTQEDGANALTSSSEAVAIDTDKPRPEWAQALFVGDMDANTNVKDPDKDIQGSRCDKKPRFFYSADDQRLEDGSEDDHLLFMRSETKEEIEEYWNSVRKRLTEDYKRKHRDAVRWRRKMASRAVRR